MTDQVLIDKVVTAIKAGRSYYSIAKELGLQTATVRAIALKAGVKSVQKSKKFAKKG